MIVIFLHSTSTRWCESSPKDSSINSCFSAEDFKLQWFSFVWSFTICSGYEHHENHRHKKPLFSTRVPGARYPGVRFPLRAACVQFFEVYSHYIRIRVLTHVLFFTVRIMTKIVTFQGGFSKKNVFVWSCTICLFLLCEYHEIAATIEAIV